MAPPDPTAVATLTLLLGRLARLHEAGVADVCAVHGTTPAEVRVLSLLSHRRGGAASPSEIAAFVVQTSGGLTATLRRLEDDGHVARRPDPADGRGKLVELTPTGRAFHDRVLDEIVARTEATLGEFDLAAVDPVVRSLVEAYERAGGVPSSAGFVAGTLSVPEVIS